MTEFLEKKKSEGATQYVASSALLKPGIIPLAVFHVADSGPRVLMRDFQSLPDFVMDEDEMFAHLQQMALGYISALGMGHAYEEGVFDLPMSGTKNYRTMLMSLKLLNPKAKDRRLMIGYYQFAFLIPHALAMILPSCSAIETGSINIIKSMLKSSDNLIPEVVAEVKERVLHYVFTFVRKQQVDKIIDEIL